MRYYIYNRLATNKKPRIEANAKLIEAIGLDYKKFFSKLAPEDDVVIVGGDMSINHFIRKIGGYKVNNNVYVRAFGYGSDFVNDIEERLVDDVLLNPYIEDLPMADIKNHHRPFINGVGFGVDGYCTATGDYIKAKSPAAKINYTTIALKGLLYKYKPVSVVVDVDGQIYQYDNVWLACTMKGRYFGGGMKIAPDQDRKDENLTVVIYTVKSRLKALLSFSKVFNGTHVNNKELVKVFTGKKVHMKFSRLGDAEVDGDTVKNIDEYWAQV